MAYSISCHNEEPYCDPVINDTLITIEKIQHGKNVEGERNDTIDLHLVLTFSKWVWKRKKKKKEYPLLFLINPPKIMEIYILTTIIGRQMLSN